MRHAHTMFLRNANLMITPGQLAGQATLCCWRHLQSLVLLLTEKNLEVRRSMLGGWKIVNVTGEHM